VLSSVNAHVPLEVLLPRKLLRTIWTNWTRVGRLSRVGPLVTQQMLLPREGLVAVRAVVGPLRLDPLVHPVMAVEMLAAAVGLGAAIVGAVKQTHAIVGGAAVVLRHVLLLLGLLLLLLLLLLLGVVGLGSRSLY